MNFFSVLQIELLKTKRTASFWIGIIMGAIFPIAALLFRANYIDQVIGQFMGKNFWYVHFEQAFKNQTVFLIPMFAIIACTLMVQVEVKNNAWKQVFTTPVNYLSIYFSKFIVILLMISVYFISFTISMIATGYILSMVDPDFGAFKTNPDFLNIIWQIGRIMFYLLPILSIHFWLSLRFKNPFMSIGTGLAMLILCIFLAAGKWDHTDAVPYTYTFWAGMHQKYDKGNIPFLEKTAFYSTLWFLIIHAASIFDFLRRKERA